MNYIVSGLERSGTSLMMQILEKANFPLIYDDKRKPDQHNPKGYYEVSKGLIINNLFNNRFNPNTYKGKFVKITSYGLQYLPKAKYKILYMTRDIYEVWKSQERMIRINSMKVSVSDEKMRDILRKMNEEAISYINDRDDIEYLIVSYNNLMSNPKEELQKISDFLNFDVSLGYEVIDYNLYRSKGKSKTELSEEEREIIEERLKELGYM